MIKKNHYNNAFTLTELIIVIVIIGILSAVLIPSLSGYVKKAKTATDKTLTKNINTVLSMESINGIIVEDAVAIRELIEESGLTYELSNPDYHLWYNKDTKQVEMLSKEDIEDLIANAEVIQAANEDNLKINLTPKTPEECIVGYILLSTDGSNYAKLCTELRNIQIIYTTDEEKQLIIKKLYQRINYLIDNLEYPNLKNSFYNFLSDTLFIINDNIMIFPYSNGGLNCQYYSSDIITTFSKRPHNVIFSDLTTTLTAGIANCLSRIQVLNIPKTVTSFGDGFLNGLTNPINIVTNNNDLINTINTLNPSNPNITLSKTKKSDYNNFVSINTTNPSTLKVIFMNGDSEYDQQIVLNNSLSEALAKINYPKISDVIEWTTDNTGNNLFDSNNFSPSLINNNTLTLYAKHTD